MLSKKTIAECSRIHTKHAHELLWMNFELPNVKHGGTHSTG